MTWSKLFASFQKQQQDIKGIRDTLQQIKKTLEQVDENVFKLIKIHYKAGLDFLNDASNIADRNTRKWLLEKAIEEFIKASHIDSPFEAAISKLNVAVCYDFLNEKKAALTWYEKAYVALLHHYQGCINDIKQRYRLRKIAYFVCIISIIGGPKLIYDMATYREPHDSKFEYVRLAWEIRNFLLALGEYLCGCGSKIPELS